MQEFKSGFGLRAVPRGERDVPLTSVSRNVCMLPLLCISLSCLSLRSSSLSVS